MAKWIAACSSVLVAMTWSAGVVTSAQGEKAPAFEVASVKPVNPDSPLRPFACAFNSGGRFRAFGTLQMLIACAYQIPEALNEKRISGGPKWLTVDLFSIEAVSPPDKPPASLIEGLAMLQTLLADRFKLVVHHQQKGVEIYELVVARADGKLGPHLQPTPPDCSRWLTAGRQGPPPPVPGDLPCGRQRVNAFAFLSTVMPMSQLANLLSARLDRTVEDRTGLTGTFSVDLQWRADQTLAAGASADNPAALSSVPDRLPTSVFTAIEEQLGLKLKPGKGSTDILIVDRAERPMPN